MIRPSFIPPREIRELRELTRRRRQLLNAGTAESPAKGSGGSEREDRKRPQRCVRRNRTGDPRSPIGGEGQCGGNGTFGPRPGKAKNTPAHRSLARSSPE